MHAPLRAWMRLLRSVCRVIAGFTIVVVRFPRWPDAARQRAVQAWAQSVLAALAIELRVHGAAPAAGPVLLVANHLSWLDIVVLLATGPCRFVSKAEIQRWPLVGTMAAAAGTLFIERASRRDAMRVVHRLADGLARGEVLAVFPEGAIGEGGAPLPFHASLLQAAIVAAAPVQPVALRYTRAADGATSRAPSYAQGVSLARSVWRTVNAQGLVAEATFGAPQPPHGRERRAWAQVLHAEIARHCVAPEPI